MKLFFIKNNIDPAAKVVLISIFIIAVVGLIRPPEGSRSELNRENFLRNKIDQPPIYDLIVAGDSRVLCDVSPASMMQVLPVRIFNYGFNFAGYTDDYLNSIESKLDKKSKNKSIVLGITPRSLTPLNFKMSEYNSENNRDELDKFGKIYFSDFISAFRPISISAIFLGINGVKTEKNFYNDGLMTVEITPSNDDYDLKTYNHIFINNKVSRLAVDNIIKKVREWKSKDISVYAFRPPVSKKIYEAEEKMSDFSQDEFIKEFSRAGGIWLPIKMTNIKFADGSHIAESNVWDFSKYLGLQINSVENNLKTFGIK